MKGKVLFTKKNTKGIYGFIACDDGSSHYFDTSGIVKGNFLKPEAVVEFDVIPSREGKTQAINVRLVTVEVEYKVLSQTQLEALVKEFESAFLERTFIDCAQLPVLLKKVGVDYKEYSEDIKSFVDKYLFGKYYIQKQYTIEGKVYPNVLIQNNSVITTFDFCDSLIQKVNAEINENGFITADKVPTILREIGIENYRDYATSMDSFIENFCNGLFVPKNRVKIKGKIYPKIFVCKEDADKF